MSVANHKFTDMKQIEFQQSGSSEVNAMLTQPLLEKPSTYTVEVTDLQCTIGEEPFFPIDEWLFTLFRLPVGMDPVTPTNYEVHLDAGALIQLVEKGFDIYDSDIFGSVDNLGNFSPNTFLDGGFSMEFDNPLLPEVVRYFGASDPYRQSDCYSAKYYSTMDFVTHCADFVKVYDRKIEAEHFSYGRWTQWKTAQDAHLAIHGDLDGFNDPEPGLLTWTEVPSDERYHISLAVDSGGRLRFWTSEFFRNHYCVLTSPLFQRITGFPTFIGWYDEADSVQTVADVEATLEYVGGAYQYVNVLVGAVTGSEFTLVRDVIPIHEGLDIRRKILLEVSLPVSHTLSWNGDKENTRFVLQEFTIPSGALSLAYIPSSGTTLMNQDQRLGPLTFLNGGTTLALKKLFSGQMQAFRIDIMVERRKWDSETMKFILESKRLDMGKGGFFYLKLLFSKETV